MQTSVDFNPNLPKTEKLKIEKLCMLFLHLYFSGQMRSAQLVLAWLETAENVGFVFLDMTEIDYLLKP